MCICLCPCFIFQDLKMLLFCDWQAVTLLNIRLSVVLECMILYGEGGTRGRFTAKVILCCFTFGQPSRAPCDGLLLRLKGPAEVSLGSSGQQAYPPHPLQKALSPASAFFEVVPSEPPSLWRWPPFVPPHPPLCIPTEI